LDACTAGIPVYGECGGFMYLCRELFDQNGKCYPMVGCFPFQTRMLARFKALGYRRITLTRDTLLGKKGDALRGHEFHYSEVFSTGHAVPTAYEVSPRGAMTATPEGFQHRRSLGSYIHLHFGSKPEAAACFVQSCLENKV
jgi:cobyrinic acid a,c-diamide synthase